MDPAPPRWTLEVTGLDCLGVTEPGRCGQINEYGRYFHIMRDSSMSMLRRIQNFVRNGHLVKFLAVGAASFAIDLGLLALLHEGAGVDLWIATPVAFLSSLVFNFLV